MKLKELFQNKSLSNLMKKYDNYNPNTDPNGNIGINLINSILKYFDYDSKKFTLYNKFRKLIHIS